MKNWRRDVMIGLQCIMMALAIGVVPWCTNLFVMLGAFFVQGYGTGYIETSEYMARIKLTSKTSCPGSRFLKAANNATTSNTRRSV